MKALTCPYCGAEAEIVSGTEVYPYRPELASRRFHLCRPCNAYVGCHPGTTTPLGCLANAELRKARMAAHAAFDLMWKPGRMRRSAAYGWLAKRMGLSKADCHIGMFDIEQCRRAIRISREAVSN